LELNLESIGVFCRTGEKTCDCSLFQPAVRQKNDADAGQTSRKRLVAFILKSTYRLNIRVELLGYFTINRFRLYMIFSRNSYKKSKKSSTARRSAETAASQKCRRRFLLGFWFVY